MLHRGQISEDLAHRQGYLLTQLRGVLVAKDEQAEKQIAQAVEIDPDDEKRQRRALAGWLSLQRDEGETLDGVIALLQEESAAALQ